MNPKTRLRIIWFAFVAHLISVLFLALALAKGLPPNALPDRLTFISTQPTLWQIGWVSWMVAAFSLVLYFFLWAEKLPQENKKWGYLAGGLAAVSALSDWIGESLTITIAPRLAALALEGETFRQLYIIWENIFLVLTSGLANLLYTIGGIILTYYTVKHPYFPKWLAALNYLLWTAALLLSFAAYLSLTSWIPVISGLTFALLLPWFLLMGYGWLLLENLNEPQL